MSVRAETEVNFGKEWQAEKMALLLAPHVGTPE